ncbi:MAG: response regulator [Pseudomonadales bacterium]
MSIKHALVVDDSKSARVSLQRMLELHHLVVLQAESGEAALELLEHQNVDVIFMDHTMPGMDGLEAVAAIKRNPQTAMIPVMMYTTKEGEVYVGQARALGAIGVLPKEVQPQALFDMLVKLGLVAERRSSSTPKGLDVPQRRRDDQMAVSGQTREHPAPGFSVEALLNRILEDQRDLRAELLRGSRVVARQVATEIVEEQMARQRPVEAADAPPGTGSGSRFGLFGLVAVLAFAAGALFWQVRVDRAGDGLAVAAGDAASRAQQQIRTLETELHTQRTLQQQRSLRAIDALQWAINRNASLPFEEVAFNDARASGLGDLLSQLVSLDFRGRVRIESHLGEFCLEEDPAGGYRPAAPDTRLEACALLGHPLDDSSSVSERESVGFAEFIANSPFLQDSGIEVELVAHDRERSFAQYPYPLDSAVAGDWNRVAGLNNRLEYSLIIDRSALPE